MYIRGLYTAFVEAGQQPCRKDDPQRGVKIQQYRMAKQQLFEALKADYLTGKLHSDQADSLTQVISESTQNPEAFWGSAKVAGSNQAIFIYEKSERLLEELLRCWLERETVI